ncbi:hypothetical protein POX_d05089 [Penicillium oxalicum]|uniref:Uncharacterized protein n=1 Tax=Penicillium oxalicum (strain 114-2 / CGMCC 5302) TaxID=933388 RepID=S7ZVH6_PENO1|nr:hypothetical protein POX_d05089 [Penicillium oxalicum]EPS32756.1 hypothetical protein PDE_07716 [Penicillium oxalicum 114-2]KAI2789595.1 hypothetical protein POX_d05089 [Penicillium oxalicum]
MASVDQVQQQQNNPACQPYTPTESVQHSQPNPSESGLPYVAASSVPFTDLTSPNLDEYRKPKPPADTSKRQRFGQKSTPQPQGTGSNQFIPPPPAAAASSHSSQPTYLQPPYVPHEQSQQQQHPLPIPQMRFHYSGMMAAPPQDTIFIPHTVGQMGSHVFPIANGQCQIRMISYLEVLVPMAPYPAQPHQPPRPHQ